MPSANWEVLCSCRKMQAQGTEQSVLESLGWHRVFFVTQETEMAEYGTRICISEVPHA